MSKVPGFLTSPGEVVRALLTYTDWWQPPTGSLLQVGGARRSADLDGFHTALLERLDERTELCHRTARLEPRDRAILYLWYVKQDTVEDIARAVRLSQRQCFRRRGAAIRRIVEMGLPEEQAASA